MFREEPSGLQIGAKLLLLLILSLARSSFVVDLCFGGTVWVSALGSGAG